MEFLDEPGEWALLPSTGMLRYWPYDPSSLLPDSATPVVASTSAASIVFEGEQGVMGQLSLARVCVSAYIIRAMQALASQALP